MAVHAAVGAVAGQAVEHQSVAFLLGVISHFFLDMIPHGDENLYQSYVGGKKIKSGIAHVGIDALVTIALCLAVYFNRDILAMPQVVAWGMFGGLIPDLLVAASQIFRPKRNRGLFWRLSRYNSFHRWNHSLLMRKWKRFSKDIPYAIGFLYQGILLFVLVKMIL